MDIICGIYSIKSPSGRYYIGQSVDIYKRWSCYHRLKCKAQDKLAKSFKKYGVGTHEFAIIEKCSIDELDDKEEYWGIYYDVLKSGLNSALRMKRQIFSEETRKKISDKRKLQIIPREAILRGHAKRKATWVITDEFRKKCSDASKGRPSPYKGKTLSDDLKELRFKNQYKPILQYSKDGGLIREWRSAAEAGRFYNSSNITTNCRGKTKTVKGFIWRYKV